MILSGGPNSAHKFGSPKVDPKLLDGRIPVLGICYGLQLMGNLLGAAKLTDRIVRFATSLVGALRGGYAHAVDYRLGLRRRTHDGRRDQPDAARKDCRGAGASG